MPSHYLVHNVQIKTRIIILKFWYRITSILLYCYRYIWRHIRPGYHGNKQIYSEWWGRMLMSSFTLLHLKHIAVVANVIKNHSNEHLRLATEILSLFEINLLHWNIHLHSWCVIRFSALRMWSVESDILK